MSKFEAHGDVHMKADGRIIYAVGEAAMNIEAQSAYYRKKLEIIEQFSGRPFAIYFRFGASALYTPEALEQVRRNVLGDLENGLIASALDFSQSDYPLILRSRFSEILDDANAEWREFQSYDAAKPWLLEKIALAEGCQTP